MTDTSPPFDFSRLTVAERILLVPQLWDSLSPNAGGLPLTNAQTRELDRRWAADQDGEMPISSWSEVKQRLLPR